MTKPTIIYGTLEQPIHTNAQYLLMQANIENGIYTAKKFIDAINNVSLDGLTKKECVRDVETQRSFLTSFANMGKTVTIKDFQPDRKKLESFVNTTFREMRKEYL